MNQVKGEQAAGSQDFSSGFCFSSQISGGASDALSNEKKLDSQQNEPRGTKTFESTFSSWNSASITPQVDGAGSKVPSHEMKET